MIHGTEVALDAHLDWVVFQIDIANIFNAISSKAIF
jgi:hypothetical protein